MCGLVSYVMICAYRKDCNVVHDGEYSYCYHYTTLAQTQTQTLTQLFMILLYNYYVGPTADILTSLYLCHDSTNISAQQPRDHSLCSSSCKLRSITVMTCLYMISSSIQCRLVLSCTILCYLVKNIILKAVGTSFH